MTSIIYWAIYFSMMYGVDPATTLAIIKVESNFNPSAVGSVGEKGLMQVRPEYVSSKDRHKLFDIKTNIKIGVQKLAKLQKECKHKHDNTFVVCYNTGVAGASRIKHAKLFPYYLKFKQEYALMEKAFKEGQRVMVKNIYLGYLDGEGVILHKGRDVENKNKWIVAIEGMNIPVDEDRISLIKE